ncbi:sec-independent translocase [Streptomyces violascens]|uniref:sec-independent translocase n=1 Tax=Streptomyces violascens TaxID=67381 RepID=UPI0036917631
MFFDIGPMDLLTLGVLAVFLFGPDKLPELIRNVTGILRKFREFSEKAQQDIRSELGPEFKDFEFEDLNPKTLVRKHVLDGEGLGLNEIRSALDPRPEVAEVAAAVRGAAGRPADAARPEKMPPVIRLEKNGEAALSARAPSDPDAT